MSTIEPRCRGLSRVAGQPTVGTPHETNPGIALEPPQAVFKHLTQDSPATTGHVP